MMKRIPLSQGKFAIVDDVDYEWLSQWKWTYTKSKHNNTGYACRNLYQGSQYVEHTYMHRAILKSPQDMDTDHISGDGLDNRRHNLRTCTASQNLANSRKRKGTTSQYKGVCWVKGCGYWKAYISCDNQQRHLGFFNSEEAAAIAYNQAARKGFGKYALLNAVPDGAAILAPPKKRLGKSSCYVGISWSRRYQRWRAEIRVNYKLIWLGHFDSEEEAARVWNAAALKHRGAKARLNMLRNS